MRRITGRPLVVIAFVLLAAACSGEDPATTTADTTIPVDSSTTSTTQPVIVVTTTSTTTTLPAVPPLAAEGDKNTTVEAAQFLINCLGYADLTVDGSFGPATKTAIQAAQTALGRPSTGFLDEDTFADMSRACPQDRRIPGDDGTTNVVGNAAVGDPDLFPIALVFGSTVTINVVTGADAVTVLLRSDDGVPVVSEDGMTFVVDTTRDYVIQVDALIDPATFTLDVTVAQGVQEEADWLITTSGISYRGTKLAIGDPAGATITKIFDYLDHGVRGGDSGEYDTGWDFPGQEGYRGIVIEGFRFLFYGPNAEFPDRGETFARVRVVAPTTDANGDPRPAFYVTTPEGIGVGNSLLDLKTAYSDAVKAGGTTRHYYRLVNSRGEICFYFGDAGAAVPTDASAITEISTECTG
jgi:peptidoglycan hydrolase-like protein with peptidoglycan-binding domain